MANTEECVAARATASVPDLVPVHVLVEDAIDVDVVVDKVVDADVVDVADVAIDEDAARDVAQTLGGLWVIVFSTASDDEPRTV